MISFDFPLSPSSRANKNYTLASTLKKPNSLIVELLFGDFREKRIKTPQDKSVVEHIDYAFEPGQVFGFAYKSLGADYKKLHQCFVLRALLPGQTGALVPGVIPGAETLLFTDGTTASWRFREILHKLKKANIDSAMLDPQFYVHLHRLLLAKVPTEYFITELIRNQK